MNANLKFIELSGKQYTCFSVRATSDLQKKCSWATNFSLKYICTHSIVNTSERKKENWWEVKNTRRSGRLPDKHWLYINRGERITGWDLQLNEVDKIKKQKTKTKMPHQTV